MCSTIYDHCGLGEYWGKKKEKKINKFKKKAQQPRCRGINKINYSGKKASALALALAKMAKWPAGKVHKIQRYKPKP